MTDPNDTELSDLLRQGRASMPRPSPAFEARVMRAYEKHFAKRPGCRRFLSFRFSMPLPFAAVAVVTLLFLGFIVGAKGWSSTGQSENVQKGSRESKSKP